MLQCVVVVVVVVDSRRELVCARLMLQSSTAYQRTDHTVEYRLSFYRKRFISLIANHSMVTSEKVVANILDNKSN